MKNEIFNVVAMPKVPGNTFDLSHEVKCSFDIGELVPTCVLDCLPGDVFKMSPQVMARFAPLVSPVMHKVEHYTHFFFVPYRILWSGFEDFITGASDVAAPYVVLQDTGSAFEPGSIGDYMGIPTGPLAAGASPFQISPYYFAAYRKIYDEYYRDQNLEVAEVFVPLVSGDNSSAYGPNQLEGNTPLIRALEHDYFTSCLPFAQKGDPVMLPLTFAAGIPVDLITADGTPGLIRDADTGALLPGTPLSADSGGVLQSGSDTGGSVYDPNGTLTVDVQSNAVTLETLRTAIVLQEFYERDARSGTRYIEKIQGQFGVRSSDARLQRPEYIGGIRSVMAISEVLATAQSSDDPATATQFVGQMAGHGVTVAGGGYMSYRVEEFGCIIGITSIIPETAYADGLHRSWVKLDAIEDFAWPAFGNLGEQAVKRWEVNLFNTDFLTDFGYQSRYAEYKSMPSRIAGEFRSSLSHWHLAQMFDSNSVVLNNDFIKAYPAKFNRIFAVPGTEEFPVDHIYARIIHQITVFRKLPRFGIPSFGSTNMG